MARVPARLQFRVQLRFVTEEQLFAAGPLSAPTPKSLLLEVHPAGEEADATVIDGEVLSRAPKLGPGARERGCVSRMCAGCACAFGAWKCGLRRLCRPGRCAPRASPPRGNAGLLPPLPLAQIASFLSSKNLGAGGSRALRTCPG